MDVHKILVGSALAAGLGIAGMVGAGTATALPGISYHDGNNEVGIGDHGVNTTTGANANATPGNSALAVSLFKPTFARVQDGTGNTVVAVDGVASVTQGNDNRVTAIGGNATVAGRTVGVVGSNGQVHYETQYANGNNVLAIGSNVKVSQATSSQTVAAVCGAAVIPSSDQDVSVTGNPGSLSKISCLP